MKVPIDLKDEGALRLFLQQLSEADAGTRTIIYEGLEAVRQQYIEDTRYSSSQTMSEKIQADMKLIDEQMQDVIDNAQDIYTIETSANGSAAGFISATNGTTSVFKIFADLFAVSNTADDLELSVFQIDTINNKVNFHADVAIDGNLMIAGTITASALNIGQGDSELNLNKHIGSFASDTLANSYVTSESIILADGDTYWNTVTTTTMFWASPIWSSTAGVTGLTGNDVFTKSVFRKDLKTVTVSTIKPTDGGYDNGTGVFTEPSTPVAWLEDKPFTDDFLYTIYESVSEFTYDPNVPEYTAPVWSTPVDVGGSTPAFGIDYFDGTGAFTDYVYYTNAGTTVDVTVSGTGATPTIDYSGFWKDDSSDLGVDLLTVQVYVAKGVYIKLPATDLIPAPIWTLSGTWGTPKEWNGIKGDDGSDGVRGSISTNIEVNLALTAWGYPGEGLPNIGLANLEAILNAVVLDQAGGTAIKGDSIHYTYASTTAGYTKQAFYNTSWIQNLVAYFDGDVIVAGTLDADRLITSSLSIIGTGDITDDALLGENAKWSLISNDNGGLPLDNANNTYVDSSGNIQGVSSGSGTAVKNSLITTSSIGAETSGARDNLAVRLGYTDYADMASKAAASGNLIATGGYLNVTLIEAEAITATYIDVDSLFAETITATGTITGATLLGSHGDFDSSIVSSQYALAATCFITNDAVGGIAGYIRSDDGIAAKILGGSGTVIDSSCSTGNLYRGVSTSGEGLESWIVSGDGKAIYGRTTGTGYAGYFTGGLGVYIDTLIRVGGGTDTATRANFAGSGTCLFARSTGYAGLSGFSSGGYGVAGSGSTYDFYAANTGYSPFTGSHDALITKGDVLIEGDIVSLESNMYNGSSSNTIGKAVTTTSSKDKRVFGVYVRNTISDAVVIAALPDDFDMSTYDSIAVNSLGEGMINVCSEGGNIEIGDYICSSNIVGKGMKQDDDLLHNYTVAKALEDVDWSLEADTVKMIACTYHCG